MKKYQRFLWASSLTVLTLVATFKPFPIVYSAETGTVNNFDELIEYLFNPAYADQFNSSVGLEIFSLPMTMYMYSISHPDSVATNISDIRTISGYISFNNKSYPAILYCSDFNLDYGGSSLIYMNSLFSYTLYNDQSSERATILCDAPATITGFPYINYSISGISGANMRLSVSDTNYGWSLSPSRQFVCRIGTTSLSQPVRPLWYFDTSSSNVSACLGLATEFDFPHVSFSPATITEDWINIVYPALKEKYPDVDDYLPIVNNAPLPEYDNWVYPPDLPIPEVPTIELPTNDIPASAMQGVSFWFTNFTTFVDKLNVGWIIVLFIAVAFLFHVIFKF